jgi:hypothetical protein
MSSHQFVKQPQPQDPAAAGNALKVFVASLPEQQAAEIHECADKIRGLIKAYGDAGLIAGIMVGNDVGVAIARAEAQKGK